MTKVRLRTLTKAHGYGYYFALGLLFERWFVQAQREKKNADASIAADIRRSAREAFMPFDTAADT